MSKQFKIGDIVKLSHSVDSAYGVVVDINSIGITATVSYGHTAETRYVHSGHDISIISLGSIPESNYETLCENSYVFRQIVEGLNKEKQELSEPQCSLNRFKDLETEEK